MLHQDMGRGSGGSDFVACALAIVERSAPASVKEAPLRLLLANAGQVPPLLIRNGAATELVPKGDCLPLGILGNAAYQDMAVDLQPADTVVFVSDGVPEAPASPPGAEPDAPSTDWIDEFIRSAFPVTNAGTGGEFYGFERLAVSAARHAASAPDAESVVQGILDDVRAWSGRFLSSDDVTLVVLRVPPHT